MTRCCLGAWRAVGATVALTGLIALAGCTSSASSGAGSHSPALSSSHLETVITPISPTRTSTPVNTPSAPMTSATTSKTASASATPTPSGPPTCTNAHLRIRALRGSAAGGQEFAAITFTNTYPAPCTMRGFPGVSLRLHNALLGRPAEHSNVAPATVLLKLGQQAEARVTDFSSCQAPLSDTVRVYAPDQTEFVDRPLELRGCRLVVDPVTRS